MTTMTYNAEQDAAISLQRERDAETAAYNQPVVGGVYCGVRYTEDEIRRALRQNVALITGSMADSEKARYRSLIDHKVEDLLSRCLRTGYLIVNDDGTYSRKVATTTAWIYTTDDNGEGSTLTAVDPKDAPRIVAEERAKLKARTPEAKTAARIDALSAELDRLRATQF